MPGSKYRKKENERRKARAKRAQLKIRDRVKAEHSKSKVYTTNIRANVQNHSTIPTNETSKSLQPNTQTISQTPKADFVSANFVKGENSKNSPSKKILNQILTYGQKEYFGLSPSRIIPSLDQVYGFKGLTNDKLYELFEGFTENADETKQKSSILKLKEIHRNTYKEFFSKHANTFLKKFCDENLDYTSLDSDFLVDETSPSYIHNTFFKIDQDLNQLMLYSGNYDKNPTRYNEKKNLPKYNEIFDFSNKEDLIFYYMALLVSRIVDIGTDCSSLKNLNFEKSKDDIDDIKDDINVSIKSLIKSLKPIKSILSSLGFNFGDSNSNSDNNNVLIKNTKKLKKELLKRIKNKPSYNNVKSTRYAPTLWKGYIDSINTYINYISLPSKKYNLNQEINLLNKIFENSLNFGYDRALNGTAYEQVLFTMEIDSLLRERQSFILASNPASSVFFEGDTIEEIKNRNFNTSEYYLGYHAQGNSDNLENKYYKPGTYIKLDNKNSSLKFDTQRLEGEFNQYGFTKLSEDEIIDMFKNFEVKKNNETDEQFKLRVETGLKTVKKAFYDTMLHFVEKYGKYLTQMHPLDLYMQAQSGFLKEMHGIQFINQLLENNKQIFDKNDPEDKKFIALSSYVDNIVEALGTFVQMTYDDDENSRVLFFQTDKTMFKNENLPMPEKEKVKTIADNLEYARNQEKYLESLGVKMNPGFTNEQRLQYINSLKTRGRYDDYGYGDYLSKDFVSDKDINKNFINVVKKLRKELNRELKISSDNQKFNNIKTALDNLCSGKKDYEIERQNRNELMNQIEEFDWEHAGTGIMAINASIINVIQKIRRVVVLRNDLMQPFEQFENNLNTKPSLNYYDIKANKSYLKSFKNSMANKYINKKSKQYIKNKKVKKPSIFRRIFPTKQERIKYKYTNVHLSGDYRLNSAVTYKEKEYGGLVPSRMIAFINENYGFKKLSNKKLDKLFKGFTVNATPKQQESSIFMLREIYEKSYFKFFKKYKKLFSSKKEIEAIRDNPSKLIKMYDEFLSLDQDVRQWFSYTYDNIPVPEPGEPLLNSNVDIKDKKLSDLYNIYVKASLITNALAEYTRIHKDHILNNSDSKNFVKMAKSKFDMLIDVMFPNSSNT